MPIMIVIPQEAPNPELSIECSTPRIGSSQNGDPCPICAEDIRAILQVMT